MTNAIRKTKMDILFIRCIVDKNLLSLNSVSFFKSKYDHSFFKILIINNLVDPDQYLCENTCLQKKLYLHRRNF